MAFQFTFTTTTISLELRVCRRARDVATENKAHVAFRDRRSSKTTYERVTRNFCVVEVLKTDAVENLLTGGQIDQINALTSSSRRSATP
jgi:hypothetical protein